LFPQTPYLQPELHEARSGLQGMADRLDAIGGTLEVGSNPGMGTTVTGRIPPRELA
jgi:signal transduction histidine kinase